MFISRMCILLILAKALPDLFHPVCPKGFAQEFADIATLRLGQVIHLPGKVFREADRENAGFPSILGHIVNKSFHYLLN
jgi:hypothetical protein